MVVSFEHKYWRSGAMLTLVAGSAPVPAVVIDVLQVVMGRLVGVVTDGGRSL
jgi:uncharacterized integral membrane protein